MNGFRKLVALSSLIPLGLVAAGGSARADGRDPGPDQPQGRGEPLSLADLAGYRAALAGKATADEARPADPPVPVRFRDLWERPGAFRGRRVTVRGRVERVFRQGPVGDFPPLVEAWIFSTAGDPFCVVFPQGGAAIPGGRGPDVRAGPPAGPEPGRTVRFTGTFLKMIRYTAGDRARLAPLIVGDQPPAPAEADKGQAASTGAGEILRAIGGKAPDGGAGRAGSAWSPAGWALGLALAILAAGLIARQHLRGAGRRNRSAIRDRDLDETGAELPLRFIDSPDGPLG